MALQFLSVFWLSPSPPTALAGPDSYLCGQFIRVSSVTVLRLYTDYGLLLYYDPGYQPTGAPVSLLWQATALDWTTSRAISPPADGGDYRVYDMYARNIVKTEALPTPDTIDKAIIGRHRIVLAPKGCVVLTPPISSTAPPQQTSPATTPIRTPPVETPPATTPVRTSPAQTPPITTPPPQATPVATPRTPPPTTATLALTPGTPPPARTVAATPFPTAPPSLTPTPPPPCTGLGCIGDNVPWWCIVLLCLLILLVAIILLVVTRRRAQPY